MVLRKEHPTLILFSAVRRTVLFIVISTIARRVSQLQPALIELITWKAFLSFGLCKTRVYTQNSTLIRRGCPPAGHGTDDGYFLLAISRGIPRGWLSTLFIF